MLGCVLLGCVPDPERVLDPPLPANEFNVNYYNFEVAIVGGPAFPAGAFLVICLFWALSRAGPVMGTF